MKRLLAALALSALALTACSGANVGNYFAPTAAVINGEKIPESAVSAQFRLIAADPQNAEIFKGPKARQNRLDAQRDILSDILRERLVLQEASTIGITVSAEEVRGVVDQQVRSSFRSESEFDKFLKDNFLSQAFVTNYFRNLLVRQKIGEAVTKDVKISEAQVQQAFDANKAQYDQMAHLAHVLICGEYNPTERKCNVSDADRQRAADVSARAKAGEDLSKLAREFSVDPSAPQNGGDLGFHPPGRFVAAFDAVAFALAVGQVSDPVETELGLHVIKMIEKGRSLDAVREELTQDLLTPVRNTAFQEWLSEKLRAARITIHPRFGRFDKNSLSIVPRVRRDELLTPGTEPNPGVPAPEPTGAPSAP